MKKGIASGSLFLLFLSASILAAVSAGSVEKPRIDPTDLAERIHAAVNRERQKEGLSPLTWDPALADMAREHSRDMAEHDYVAHVNPAGEDPTQRGERAGYRCRKRVDGFIEAGLAENLSRNSLFYATRYTVFGEREAEIEEKLWSTPEQIVESTVRSWMESEGHRENLLYPHHESEGIGVVIDADGKVYVTQLFC